MGPLPLIWGCIEPVVCGEKLGAATGAEGMLRPSNLGSGAATVSSARNLTTASQGRTAEGQLRGRIAAGLVVADETQDLAEAGHGQQAAVLRVGNLPYLAQHRRRQLRPLEELDGDFARDDAELLGVGLLKQVLEDALLLGREVEDGLVCARLAAADTRGGCIDILNSPLLERSAMAAAVQARGAWCSKVDACLG